MSKKGSSSLGGSEAFIREQLESVQKDTKGLRQRMEQLQLENDSLTRSLNDLRTSLY